MGGFTQARIVEEMTKRGMPCNQSSVSRWLKKVEAYRDAGGMVPDLGNPKGKPEFVTLDPEQLTRGRRVSALKPRPSDMSNT